MLICRTRHGFVCANAGVDPSNAPEDGGSSCSRAIPTRARARCAPRCPSRPAVVIADSFGRAWRVGQCDVAIGIAGLAPVDDWRGRRDRAGASCARRAIAIADEAAAAADLARGKDAREPVVVVRGLDALRHRRRRPRRRRARAPARGRPIQLTACRFRRGPAVAMEGR